MVYCYRSNEYLAPKSNHPQGYWYITEIITSEHATVWRKRKSGDWIRLASSFTPNEKDAFELGNLVKHPTKGIILANGSIHERLESKLTQHMENENKTSYPYNYWEKNWFED